MGKKLYGYHHGTLIQLIYFKDFIKTMNALLQLHGLQPTAHCVDGLSQIKTWFNPPVEPKRYELWLLDKDQFICHEEETDGSMPPLRLFMPSTDNNTIFVVKTIEEVNRCIDCGVKYVKKHTCNSTTASFFHHILNTETKDDWNFVKFSPVGCPPETKRAYIVYDIETYTQHGAYGKQLVPYLLVMQIVGDVMISRIARQIAVREGFICDATSGCLYIMHTNADVIGQMFKVFRNKLQLKVALNLWTSYCRAYDIDSNVTKNELEKIVSEIVYKGKECFFWEIVVVGHNISGFDEIILAAHVMSGVDREDERLSPFKIKRTFMPRVGKLLFNDVAFMLPNPAYDKPTDKTYKRWKRGSCSKKDKKWQGLTFMVRDTYLLTHTSLRNAAKAYNLELSKGVCPYTAVNEFLMTGKYKHLPNKYPLREYWNSDEDYQSNMPPEGGTYNILNEALKYCILDVLLTAQLVKALVDGYQMFCTDDVELKCNFHIFQKPTISSNTHALFKQVFYKNHQALKDYLPGYMVPSGPMYDFIRKSVRGGRCYPTYLGVYNEPVYVYDVCGMYASALTHPLPYGHVLPPAAAVKELVLWQNRLDNPKQICYFDNTLKHAIVCADCIPPDHYQLDTLPPICSRDSGRLCWTNEPLAKQVLTTVDIITLHNRGWKCSILLNEPSAVWPEFKPICSSYVQINIRAKEQADKTGNQVKRSISKLLSNALYGSFCTKLDNKKVIFESDLTKEDIIDIQEERSQVKVRTTIVNSILPHSSANIHLPQSADELKCTAQGALLTPYIVSNQSTVDPYNKEEGHSRGEIQFCEAECDDLILTTLEKTSEWIENRSYPTQIASFVLAWTRAFTSEWSGILYNGDRYSRIKLEDRELKHLYGDTDSLFVTKTGHDLMKTVGAAKLKKNGAPLVFNPDDPKLTWAVECETVCEECGGDAYSDESCFLAPKLYGIKSKTCEICHKTSDGKIRAKGHPREQVTYDLLKKCFLHYDFLRPTECHLPPPPKEFETNRISMKRTLISSIPTAKPFTVVEKNLSRVIRPWKDMTLRVGQKSAQGYYLYPYDKQNPNPRTIEPSTSNPFWEDT